MANQQNEWVKRRWALLIEAYGGKCEACPETCDLEFAHIKPTKCKGMGRGKYRRLRDILAHPKSYRLLCMTCHDLMDGRTVRKRQPEIRKVL